MKPPITQEGQSAKNRIAEVRQNISNGSMSAGARATVRALEKPTAENQRRANQLNEDNTNFVAFGQKPPAPLQPSVSAQDIANPLPQVNPPIGTPPAPNGRVGSLIGNVQRDTQGFITNTSAEAQKARDLANEMASLSGLSATDFRQEQNNQYQIPENLKTLQDIQLQLSDRKTNTELQNSQINNAAGQTIGQAQREVTQNDREAAIRDAGLAARAAVLQGNIETASTLVSQAVSDFTSDRSFKNEQMINQLNYFQGLADDQTAQLLEQEKRKYEEDQAAIERSQAAVDAAMTSGAATESDIAQLTNPSLTDEQRLSIAQGIVGRGNAEMRNLEIASKRSSLYTSSLQQQKLIAELNPTESGNSGDLIAYGQQFAESGKLPSVTELKQSGLTVGQVTEYAKQAPKPDGAILSTNTGIKSSSISAGQEDGINALYDIQKKVADLKTLDEERQKGVVSATFGKVFGSGDQQRYVDLRGEIVDLLARARTGAALTTQEEKFYADQLPGRIGQVGVVPGTGAGLFGTNSQNRIDNFSSKIKGTLDTKLSGTGTIIQGYSKVNVPSLGSKTVGEIVNIGDAQYRVLPDGTLTDII